MHCIALALWRLKLRPCEGQCFIYLSPGSTALRPGQSSTQQGSCKSPAAAAWADLQQGCHSTILWGMSLAPCGVGGWGGGGGGCWTEVSCGLKGTDGWTVRGQCFLWKAIQRILWQRLSADCTSSLLSECVGNTSVQHVIVCLVERRHVRLSNSFIIYHLFSYLERYRSSGTRSFELFY